MLVELLGTSDAGWCRFWGGSWELLELEGQRNLSVKLSWCTWNGFVCTEEEDEAVGGDVLARGAICGSITAALLIAPSVQPFAPLHFLKGLPLPPLPPFATEA